MENLNYLYSKDGKKYAVISKIIGTTQIICREVMIEKGTEKEVLNNGVVTLDESTLYNVPVESWQENKMKELAKELEDLQNDCIIKKKNFRSLINGYSDQTKDFLEIRSKFLKFCKNNNDPFIKLADFVTGAFEFAIVRGYKTNLYTKEEFYDSMKRRDGMRTLVPEYASNNPADAALKMADYSDGSGIGSSDVYFYNNHHDAKDAMKEFLTKDVNSQYGFDKEKIEMALEYGVEIPYDKVQDQLLSVTKGLESVKKEYDKQHESRSKDLEYFEQLMKYIEDSKRHK